MQKPFKNNFRLQLEALERNKLSGAELLSRIQLLEGRVDAATAVTGTAADTASTAADDDATCGSSGGVGVSPFAQARLMKQVAVLEQQVSVLQTSSTQLTFNTDQVRPADCHSCHCYYGCQLLLFVTWSRASLAGHRWT